MQAFRGNFDEADVDSGSAAPVLLISVSSYLDFDFKGAWLGLVSLLLLTYLLNIVY